jgi:uncharacterized Zn finger protein (UPF0148 family)
MPATNWRFRCPRDHTNWTRYQGRVYCESCQRAGLDAGYCRLWDARRGELIEHIQAVS